jgi:hypothetical protein
MTDQDNAQALVALARARGVDLDPDATHLSLQQVAMLATESEITTRRAIWKGLLKAETFGFRYQIPILAAAEYVAQGGGRFRTKEGD